MGYRFKIYCWMGYIIFSIFSYTKINVSIPLFNSINFWMYVSWSFYWSFIFQKMGWNHVIYNLLIVFICGFEKSLRNEEFADDLSVIINCICNLKKRIMSSKITSSKNISKHLRSFDHLLDISNIILEGLKLNSIYDVDLDVIKLDLVSITWVGQLNLKVFYEQMIFVIEYYHILHISRYNIVVWF